MAYKHHTTPLATFSHIALTINRDPKDLPPLLGFLTNLQMWFTTFPFFCVPKAKDKSILKNTLLVKNTNKGIKYHTIPLATFFHIALTINRDPKTFRHCWGFLPTANVVYNSPFLLRSKGQNKNILENTLLVKNAKKGIKNTNKGIKIPKLRRAESAQPASHITGTIAPA